MVVLSSAPPLPSAPLAEWARWYASVLSWAIFPCRGKAPLIPTSWHAATQDLKQIEEWWTRWPDANIGLPGGTVNQLVIADIDPRHGGKESWNSFCAEYQYHPDTAYVRSGGKDQGVHFYYASGNQPVRTRNPLLPGIDIRATGSYVLLPPSIHPDTHRRYKWEVGLEHLKTIPDWMVKRIGLRTNTAAPDTDDELEELARQQRSTIAEGGRKNFLLRLAGTLIAKGLSPESVEVLLRNENRLRCKPPLPDEEIEDVMKSARSWRAPVSTGERCTDFGNAHRLLIQYGHRIRFDNAQGKWRIWDGRRWALDDREEIRYIASQVIDGIHEEAALETSNGARQEELAKWANRSETPARLTAMLESALSAPEMIIRPEDMDADPLLLNCQNGTLDLRTGKLEPHNPSQMLTRIIPWEYDPNAPEPEQWLRFLQRILPGEELQQWAQQAAGYCLSGVTWEQCFFLLWGTGNNGKSTFLDVLRGVLGPDYSMAAPRSLLLEHQPGQITNDLADLPGMRLVAYAEFPREGRIDIEVIKGLTGESSIKARHLYKENFDVRPECKLFVTANTRPTIGESTEAVWRRMRMVPFTVQIGEKERKDEFFKTLLQEAPCILKWMLQGWQNFRARGRLLVPQTVQEATRHYRIDSDLLQQFMNERCIKDPAAAVPLSELLTSLHGWLLLGGQSTRRYGRPWLKEELMHHNFPLETIEGVLSVPGLKLREDQNRTVVWDG